MKQVYLSHPYGGKKENRESAERLASIYKKQWAKESSDCYIFNPLDAFQVCEEIGLSESVIMKGALEVLSHSDMVLFAPEWEKSSGCRAEYLAAIKQNIPMYFIPASMVA